MGGRAAAAVEAASEGRPACSGVKRKTPTHMMNIYCIEFSRRACHFSQALKVVSGGRGRHCERHAAAPPTHLSSSHTRSARNRKTAARAPCVAGRRAPPRAALPCPLQMRRPRPSCPALLLPRKNGARIPPLRALFWAQAGAGSGAPLNPSYPTLDPSPIYKKDYSTQRAGGRGAVCSQAPGRGAGKGTAGEAQYRQVPRPSAPTPGPGIRPPPSPPHMNQIKRKGRHPLAF